MTQCLTCGGPAVNGLFGYRCANCDQVKLLKQQNKIHQESLNLQKKQQQQNAAQEGGFMGGFNSTYNGGGTGFVGAIVKFFVHLYIIWPYQIIKALWEMYQQFEAHNPELARKIKRFFLILSLVIVALALITKGIQDLYTWADTYNYGLVGFWIVAVIVGGFIALMVLPLLFSQKARDRFKKSYDEGYNGTTQNLNSESHKDSH